MTEKKEKKEKKPRELPEPEHLDWLVENRAATQKVSAKLYKLLKGNPNAYEDRFLGDPAQMLVATSFSLWRSAFLSDKTGERKDTNIDALGLLGEMLLTNAIAFNQERTSKDWTFNYYAGNALYRLEQLRVAWPGLKMGRLRPPLGERNPKNRWKYLQRAFDRAVDHFEQLLAA